MRAVQLFRPAKLVLCAIVLALIAVDPTVLEWSPEAFGAKAT
jgi:hypothetical protein